MTIKPTRIDFTEVVTDARFIYVIAYDRMAGSRGRYTAHAIRRFGLCAAIVIGRELPLGHARRVRDRHRTKEAGRV